MYNQTYTRGSAQTPNMANMHCSSGRDLCGYYFTYTRGSEQSPNPALRFWHGVDRKAPSPSKRTHGDTGLLRVIARLLRRLAGCDGR
jgi:hypothetical protein